MGKKVKYEAYTKEIRNRFGYVISSFLCCYSVCYYKATQLMYMFVSSCLVKDSLHQKVCFIFTDVREAFSATLLICLFFSLCSLSSFVIYSFVCFFLPCWFAHERRGKLTAVVAICLSCILYTFGVHSVILPRVLNFFWGFQVQNIECFSLMIEPRIYSYVVWGIWFLVFASFLFLFVCLLLFLIIKGRISMLDGGKNRRSRLFGSLLLAALVSPPELSTQSLLFLALFLLFESIVFFALLYYHFLKKRRGLIF